MLKPIKKEKKENHSVLDIETGKKGNLLAMSLYNDLLDKPIHFFSWIELLDFLELNNEIDFYQKIFAHNGGGFDWVHLFGWYFTESNCEKDKIEIVLTGSAIIFGQINYFKKPVTFCDSLLTLKSSLSQLCKVFNPDVKKLKDFDINNIEKIFNENPALFWKYLDNDVLSLHHIMNRFMDLIDIEFFPLTVASLGLYKFKKDFLQEDIKIFKPSVIEDEFISDSYAGGRVECFRQGKFDKIFSYDINSLYPFIMHGAEIPICQPVQTKQYIKGDIGFYRINFNQTDKTIPAILWKKTNKYGLVFCYEGQGVFCSHEIELALSLGVEIKFFFGFVYPKTTLLFREYVDYYYNLRLKYDKSNPMNLIAKYLLNSLYGKWGQKETTDKLVCLPVEKYRQLIDDGKTITDYDTAKNLYVETTTRPIPHRIIFIASIITSLARCEIYKYIKLDPDTLIYCDTDSYHTTKEIDFNLGNKLGQMKLEETGQGIYIGRKMYAIKNGKKEKITFKGLSTKSSLPHDELTFEHFEKVLHQTKNQESDREQCHKYMFHNFPKLKTVLRGQGKAAEMKQIIKVLKKPEYTTNFLRQESEYF